MPLVEHVSLPKSSSLVRQTYEIMDPYIHSNPQLCANAIRSTNQDWVDIPSRLEVECTAKPSDLGVGTWPSS